MSRCLSLGKGQGDVSGPGVATWGQKRVSDTETLLGRQEVSWFLRLAEGSPAGQVPWEAGCGEALHRVRTWFSEW